MLHSVINSLFGCSHNRTTFPITRGRKSLSVAAAATSNAGNRTYVVCLDCGKEFAYDWKSMSVGQPVESLPSATTEPLYR
jgi:hypothetical protein